MSQGPSPELFFTTMFAYQKTAAMKAAIELDLFTAIGDGASTVPDIARATGASERGTRILCDFLTVNGFLEKSNGKYELTPDSAVFLTKRSPAYLGGTIDFLATPELVRNADVLTDTIRRGTISVEGNNTVSEANPIWDKFARAMVPMAMPTAQAIADVLDVAGAGAIRVLDIAAGHGMYGITIAQRNPKAEVVAVDWPSVLAVASEHAAGMGVGDRHRTVAGDAFTVDWGPDYDIALVTNFLHHFDAAKCTTFLRKVADSLKPGGRVAVLEFVPNEDRVSPAMPAAFAMTMLAGTESGEAYTFSELRGMLTTVGFSDVSQHPAAAQTVVVATK
jgi:2-polyprenyl-3-methyl-5-hydroxy-6-metoxy-1,4-benzoquinol methylase